MTKKEFIAKYEGWFSYTRREELKKEMETDLELVSQSLRIHDVSSLLKAEREATKEEIREWLRGEDFEGLAERL